uniref:Uncharacterized protein n=1 Tax=Arundo donax TaxID=35708 RepID=A0A0A9F722_ARUDO
MFKIWYGNTLLDCVANRWRGLLDIYSYIHPILFAAEDKRSTLHPKEQHQTKDSAGEYISDAHRRYLADQAHWR